LFCNTFEDIFLSNSACLGRWRGGYGMAGACFTDVRLSKDVIALVLICGHSRLGHCNLRCHGVSSPYE